MTIRIVVICIRVVTPSDQPLWINISHIARFMGPTWGPSGAVRTQVGPMWAPRNFPIWDVIDKTKRNKYIYSAHVIDTIDSQYIMVQYNINYIQHDNHKVVCCSNFEFMRDIEYHRVSYGISFVSHLLKNGRDIFRVFTINITVNITMRRSSYTEINYCQIFNISSTKSQTLICFLSCLAVVFAQSIEAR